MKEQLLAFWRSRDPREQKIIAVGGFLLALVLLYAYLWLPMSQQRERLRLPLPVMNGQLAQMKTQAREIATAGLRQAARFGSGDPQSVCGSAAIKRAYAIRPLPTTGRR